MLDLNRIREDRTGIEKALAKRMEHIDFTELLNLDERRRKIQAQSESLKAKRNKVSNEIPELKKQRIEIGPLIEEMKKVSIEIKDLDEEFDRLSHIINDMLSRLPNIPADDVVAGDKENNIVVRTWGSKPHFDFSPRNHVEISEALDIIDYKKGVKLGGSGFWVYKNYGALLEWALLNYFIEEHLQDDYEFIIPPHILNYQSGYTAGQFPKFEQDVFSIQSSKERGFDHFLLPTAETALVNLHRDELLKEADLPRRYFAYSPCFRKEAGGYRSDERGMIRGHQFNKIELFQYTTPEQSEKSLAEMIEKSERLVRGLGLHFQVSKLAAKDCSDSMAKTFDIEVWLPSIHGYKEISSASNAHDYQARRGNLKFKRELTGKTEFVHTLNASGLATSRLFPAILEHYQQNDGSVVIPQVLRKWMGTDLIKPIVH